MLNIFASKKEPNQHATASFLIRGMHCVACAMDIDGMLEDHQGIISSTTSYQKSQTKVEYDHHQLTPDKIQALIEKTGYHAEVT